MEIWEVDEMQAQIRPFDISETAVQKAARDLYEAEVGLHIARSSGVDQWVAAAADRLHVAVESYELALLQDSRLQRVA
jgi:hypothetical protein